MKHRVLMLALVLSLGVGVLADSASTTVFSQVRALEQQEKTALQDLSRQMADLKDRHQAETSPLQQQLVSFNAAFEGAMKQLRDQYDGTRNRDDDERAALMDRIKPGYLALYGGKKQSLATVNSQEDQAAQSLRQQEDAELQGIRDKYDAQRKNLQQQSAAQRQSIESQFDAEVKALK
jgi:hypothetical protein